MKHTDRAWAFAAMALPIALAAWSLGAAEIADGTTRTYTASATVDETLSGSGAVEVNIPNAYATTGERCGWTGIVAFTADNSAFSGDVTVVSGGVLVSNLTALGTGRIKMHPHTALFVAVSYKDANQSLKEKIIDRIDVQNPNNLTEPDLWVSFQVQGDGLRNDVDFSGQPYLWLSAPRSKADYQNTYETLDGTFTPYGNTYKLGYNYIHYGETVCLAVDNLCDGANGESRGVVFRGPSASVIGRNWTFTGRIRIEDGAGVNFNGDGGLGPVPPEARTDQITISGADCRLNPRCASVSLHENIGITIESGATVTFSPGGNTEEKYVNVFNGPLCGSGAISITDNGGFWFTATNNTFSGDITMNHRRTQWFKIGTGDRFSWGAGGTLNTSQHGGTPAGLVNIVLDSDEDATFDMLVTSTAGRLVKRGTGTLTLAQAPTLTEFNGLPALSVEGGTLKRGWTAAAELPSWVLLGSGAAFDLGGYSDSNVFLPYGEGTLLNPAEGTAVEIVQSAITNDQTFAGCIVPPAKVTVEGTTPWRVGAGAKFDGGLEVAGGPVRFEDGVALTEGAVTLDADAVLTCLGSVSVASLAGTGRIRLASDGTWPVVTGENAFAGTYEFPSGTAQTTTLVPSAGSALVFNGELAASRDWTCLSSKAGCTYVTNVGHRAELVLTTHPDGKTNSGTLHSPEKIDVTSAPWTLSFALRSSLVVWQGNRAYGDGFAFIFQDAMNDKRISLGNYGDDATVLCAIAGTSGAIADSYGIQLWSSDKSCTWIKDGVRNTAADARLKDVSCLYFGQWEANPLEVTLTYDGEKMVAAFTCGSASFATTNANAAAELAERFPNGAYVSMANAAGGWRCGLTVESFRFSRGALQPSVFAGALDLSGGTVELVDEGVSAMTLSGALTVRGATTLACDGTAPLRFASTDWTFDFSGGKTPSLVLPAAVEWPETLTVTLAGAREELPSRWTTIVDGQAFAAAGGVWPTVSLKVPSGANCLFRIEGGLLQVRKERGAMIIIR